MKKWIIVAVFLLFISLIASYFLLPSSPTIAGKQSIRTSIDGVYRGMTQQPKWDSLSNGKFKITKRLLNSLRLNIEAKGGPIPLEILLVPVTNDSVVVNWTADLQNRDGLFSRWNNYFLARNTGNKIDRVLNNFRNHLSDDRNIYGIHIIESSTTDTLLIATKFTCSEFPTTPAIYLHIKKLYHHARQHDAIASGYPMLNVTREDSTTFRCMVALPVNKVIPGRDEISFVRMVPGKFLTTEITGGPHTIAHAHHMMQSYFKDFKRTAMAIPFEYLITDRLKEPDTSKWVTKIYGPVY